MRLLARTCPKCERNVRDSAALFCPYCGTELAPTSVPTPSKKELGFPIAVGILTIIAACISAITGIIGMIAFEGSIVTVGFSNSNFSANYPLFYVGMFGILGFSFGMTAGVFSLKRKYFDFSMIGMYLVFVSGVATMIAFALAENNSWVPGLPFGLPVVILSILSVILTTISKGEFF
jgi:hypothetical protein